MWGPLTFCLRDYCLRLIDDNYRDHEVGPESLA